ncbi:MAG: YiiX/YebB-like N1pC/P60 family cysteine hydrolase [Gammaproteobacteria bacterium]|nr:YiiX/YebB-like N1pC/P60 family cysteine hydrolase [Gammaproteobacteria bacterium]
MDDFPVLPPKSYTELRREIRSGDILLCSGSGVFSNLIQNATNSVWSHVGFVLRLDVIERIMILESVENIGVRTVPLSSYVYDYNATGKGYPGRLMIARHRDLREDNIVKLSKFATSLLGYPYNSQEIIRIAMRIGLGTVGLQPQAPDDITQRAFICSEYAYLCFKSVGITIDYDPLGFISPADFVRCKKVQPLGYIDPDKVAQLQTSRKKLTQKVTETV